MPEIQDGTTVKYVELEIEEESDVKEAPTSEHTVYLMIRRFKRN